MPLSKNDIQTALRIKRAVNEYLEKTTETIAPAKELMNLFISKGIFKSNHQDGYPIRKFLTLLNDNGYLKLIPQAHYDPKEQNKNWYFIRSNKTIS